MAYRLPPFAKRGGSITRPHAGGKLPQLTGIPPAAH
jgi:hypothetical protein